MAEVKNEDEVQEQQPAHGIPTKRKTDLPLEEDDKDKDEKKQRLENSADTNCSSLAAEEKIDGEDEDDDDEEEYEEEDDGDEDDDEDEDFDDEHSNGKVEVDRKGKGILREDRKGKGKLIEESDVSSDGGGIESDGDNSSDLSEDPLAEVDLDNILPSRTRRRTIQPGLCISKEPRDDRDA